MLQNFEIKTNSGTINVICLNLEIEQKINFPTEFRVLIQTTSFTSKKIEKLLGQVVSFYGPEEYECFVSAIDQHPTKREEKQEEYAEFLIHGSSKLGILKYYNFFRTFRKKKTSDLIDLLLADCNLEYKKQYMATDPEQDCIIQYGETNFEIFQDILYFNKFFCFSGPKDMVISSNVFLNSPEIKIQNYIYNNENFSSQRFCSETFLGLSYSSSETSEVFQNNIRFGNKPGYYSEFFPAYTTPNSIKSTAESRQNFICAKRLVLYTQYNKLQPGLKINYKDQTYLVLSVKHTHKNVYYNEIEIIEFNSDLGWVIEKNRHKIHQKNLLIRGHTSDNIDNFSNYGVSVRFNWDANKQDHLARISSQSTGSNMGLSLFVQPKQEALIFYDATNFTLNIVGFLFNQQNLIPEDEKSGSYLRYVDEKGLTSELEINHAKEQNLQLSLYDKNNSYNNLSFNKDGMGLLSKSKIKIESESGETTYKKNLDQTIGGKMDLVVDEKTMINFKALDNISLTKNLVITENEINCKINSVFESNKITLKSGEASIELSQGNISIKGLRFSIDSKMVDIVAGPTNLKIIPGSILITSPMTSHTGNFAVTGAITVAGHPVMLL